MSSLREEDKALFQENYKSLYPEIYSYFYYRANRDHAAAEDSLHDVYEKAWKAYPGFKEKASFGKFRQWIYQIAKNHAIDLHRRRKIVDWRPLEDDALNPAMFVDDPQSGFGDRDLVREALKALSFEDREALLRYNLYGHTQDDLAVFLGIKKSAVKMHMSRVRQRFRQVYADLEHRR